MRWAKGAALDLCCVISFVGIGRAGHAEGVTVAGLAATAWPFAAGAATGWVATRAWRRPWAMAPTGIGVWLATIAVGMVLRVLSGQGTVVAFVVVASAFLGTTMLGWRAVARWTARAREHGRSARAHYRS